MATNLRGMYHRFRFWFSGLTRRAKVAIAAIIAIGAVATAVGALPMAINAYLDLFERLHGNSLELVDAGFTQAKVEPTHYSEEVGYTGKYCERARRCLAPALDFKLANSSDDPIIIKRADIQVKKAWTFSAPFYYSQQISDHCAQLGGMEPTFNYDVELPNELAPYTIRKNLSQSIEAGETDRFTITLHGGERTKVWTEHAVLLEVSLVYGEDNETIPTKQMLYGRVEPIIGFYYSYHQFDRCWIPRDGLSASDVARLTKQNEQSVSEISRLNAPKNASLKRLLRNVSGERSYNRLSTVSAPSRNQ